jgi:hypothetical protein
MELNKFRSLVEAYQSVYQSQEDIQELSVTGGRVGFEIGRGRKGLTAGVDTDKGSVDVGIGKQKVGGSTDPKSSVDDAISRLGDSHVGGKPGGSTSAAKPTPERSVPYASAKANFSGSAGSKPQQPKVVKNPPPSTPTRPSSTSSKPTSTPSRVDTSRTTEIRRDPGGGPAKDPAKEFRRDTFKMTREEIAHYEELELIDEAEGSYGQTPKSRKSYGDLANKRRSTPASGFSQRGEKTKKVKTAEKHFNRTGNPDAGNRGKKSTKPSFHSGKRSGMTQSDRDYSRGEAEYGHTGYDPDFDGGPSAPGGKPKGKKAERQKKTGVSAESFNAYESVLSYLIDEGFASTEESADKIILSMSESWFEEILNERTRYAKETGKSLKTGRASVKGGNEQIKKRVEKEPYLKYGGSREKPKVRGEKPPRAGEPGSGVQDPAHKVSLRRTAKELNSQKRIGSRFD